ncbi:MAG: hypothetical protein ACK5Z5_03960 [Neisseriaceae bacterium]
MQRFLAKKYPSAKVLYEDLKPVFGRHGNKYFIYWDEKSLSNSRYADDIEKLRSVFNSRVEVKAGKNSSGIKRLINNNLTWGVFSHELKSKSTKSRIYGFIRRTDIGFVVIFCHFDHGGKLTKH